MPLENYNPYSASQVLPERCTSPLWRSLINRAGIGILVGTAAFGLVHLFVSEEKNGIDVFLFSMCVIVTTVSTFTQSETARKNGRTGIIPAIILCLASALVASLLIHALIETPPNLKGYEKEWAEYHRHHQKRTLLTWVFLYAALICGYFFLYCRQQSKVSDTNEQEENPT